ncbi:hypothetical protein MMC18_000361 [Xylographa bjoerkii]|nr:hypothetical protein [Xylographa bjoerkii]
MAFQSPLPNALTFATVPESIWRCCTCSVTNAGFTHPDQCALCNHRKCPNCTEDTRAAKPWQPAVFLRETTKYNAFPPRNKDIGEVGELDDELPVSPPQISATISASPKVPGTSAASQRSLEQIARATPQATRLDVDRVTRDNPDIEVLQGYRGKSNLNFKPERYYEWQQEFYSQPQLRQSFGLYEGESVHYGFEPEDLSTKGALYKKNVLPNNLNNPIHEIFNIDHWTNMEDSIYEVLKPALRLASMYLQQPVAFQWWCTVMFGERSLDLEESKTTSFPVQRIKEQVEVTSQNSPIIVDYLKRLGTHVVPGEGHVFNFRFREEDDMSHIAPKSQGHCHGCSCLVFSFGAKNTNTLSPWTDYQVVTTRYPKGKYNRVDVAIHSDYYIAARKFRDTTHQDTNHILRFYFLFAATLVHEVSHCLEFIDAYHGNENPSFLPDPFLGAAPVRESGFSWERSTFGGIINPINNEPSARFGVAICDWPNPDQYEWQLRHYAIRMDYIESIQRKENWDLTSGLPEDAGKSRYLYVPRHECAVAWMHPTVMPMHFEELEKERLWNIEEEKELEEDRLERLEYEQNDKIHAELDRKEEIRKARERGIEYAPNDELQAEMNRKEEERKAGQEVLAEEAVALLERERKRRDKDAQRLEDEARASYRERFGDDDPWMFDNLKNQQSKRPFLRLLPRKHVDDRRSESPELQPEAIPMIDNEATREITQIRKERSRRETREAEEKKRRERDQEREEENANRELYEDDTEMGEGDS